MFWACMDFHVPTVDRTGTLHTITCVLTTDFQLNLVSFLHLFWVLVALSCTISEI